MGSLFFVSFFLASFVETDGTFDFVDRGDAFDCFQDTVLAHIKDSLRFRCFFDLAFTRVFAEHLFDGSVHEDTFVDGDTAFVAGEGTLLASGCSPEGVGFLAFAG